MRLSVDILLPGTRRPVNAANPPFNLAFQITGNPVPEPSTLAIAGLGLVAFLILAWRRRRARWAQLCVLAVILFIATTLPSVANVIDFETTPGGGSPVDDAVLNTPYNITGGGTVFFYFDNNLNNTYDAGTDSLPNFEAAGQDGTDGFASTYWGINDTAYPGYAAELGNFFLRQPVPGTVPPPFIVEYNTSQTITALSGEIWDIDGSSLLGTEQWLVNVLDSANNVLASELSPLGNSSALDSKPWVFSFTGLPLGVEKVSLTFVGSKTQGLGLAFNNFSPTTAAVPEPSSALLAILAASGLLGYAWYVRSGVAALALLRRWLPMRRRQDGESAIGWSALWLTGRRMAVIGIWAGLARTLGSLGWRGGY